MNLSLDELLYPFHDGDHVLELRDIGGFVDLLDIDDFHTLVTH